MLSSLCLRRTSPRRSEAGRERERDRERVTERERERERVAEREQYSSYERDEPDLYGEQYAPYARWVLCKGVPLSVFKN